MAWRERGRPHTRGTRGGLEDDPGRRPGPGGAHTRLHHDVGRVLSSGGSRSGRRRRQPAAFLRPHPCAGCSQDAAARAAADGAWGQPADGDAAALASLRTPPAVVTAAGPVRASSFAPLSGRACHRLQTQSSRAVCGASRQSCDTCYRSPFATPPPRTPLNSPHSPLLRAGTTTPLAPGHVARRSLALSSVCRARQAPQGRAEAAGAWQRRAGVGHQAAPGHQAPPLATRPHLPPASPRLASADSWRTAGTGWRPFVRLCRLASRPSCAPPPSRPGGCALRRPLPSGRTGRQRAAVRSGRWPPARPWRSLLPETCPATALLSPTVTALDERAPAA